MIRSLFRDNRICQIAVYICMCFMITNQILQDQSCEIDFEDEFWPLQWYLNKSATNKYDMNILPAWRTCINGTGVTVGVVDNGVQDHVDLNINRDLDFGNDSGTVDSLKHGTRVAGVIGALKNEDSTVGLAFGSVIADITIASSEVYETFDVEALIHRSDIIDVYSCSFSNVHNGIATHPLLKDHEDALINGTTWGRGGLGSVYIFATGNSGDESKPFRDSCAYDRLVTNRYVISVAGIQYDLSKVPSGEACSAMMVAAFTAKTDADDYKIVTTDIDNTSTEYFNQNSAATPMVSGAVALALSANPLLSYRDVMHLLVLTSRANLSEFEHGNYFMRNAANLSVSSYFGFGLLDVGALVEKSMVWKSVPLLKTCSFHSGNNEPIGGGNHIVHVNACDVTYTEHVEVSLKINDKNAGLLQWVLISPYETRSTIIPGRSFDGSKRMNLTVLTVQMWGENPNGYWKLVPIGIFTADGIVESFRIDIHGFTCMSDFKCLQPAEQELQGVTSPLPNVPVGEDEISNDTVIEIVIGIGCLLGFLIIISLVLGYCYWINKKKETLRSEPNSRDHKMEYI